MRHNCILLFSAKQGNVCYTENISSFYVIMQFGTVDIEDWMSTVQIQILHEKLLLLKSNFADR